MQYPLQLSFKILALAPQLSVTEATGQVVMYVKQKLFKLKESVTVFADATQTEALYTINADRILDFSPRFSFADMQGNSLGAVKRHGAKSLWKAHYSILEGEEVVMSINEENPWVKMLDELLGEIPVVGLLTGYLLHPTYLVTRPDGETVLRLRKQPAFFESKFTIESSLPLNTREETQALLGLITLVLLERGRG